VVLALILALGSQIKRGFGFTRYINIKFHTEHSTSNINHQLLIIR